MNLQNLKKVGEIVPEKGKAEDKLAKNKQIARTIGGLSDEGNDSLNEGKPLPKGDETNKGGERKEKGPKNNESRTVFEFELDNSQTIGKGAFIKELDKNLFALYKAVDQEAPFTASLAANNDRRDQLNNWAHVLSVSQKVMLSIVIDHFSEKFDEKIEAIRIAKKASKR